jgi:hypothetical protein
MTIMKIHRELPIVALSFIILSFSIAFSSCRFEQEDYFPESASLRITHLNEQLKERLVNQSDTTQQKYGWVMQYFVAGTDDYNFEGFNLFGRFYDNGSVTMASNHRYLRNGNANKYTEHTSTYEMLAEEGPVLSFNTWNDILTVFEDPVSPTAAPGTISSDGEGMRGDHNLVLSTFDDGSITFRGERHGAETRFIPCDRPWKDYMDAVAKTKSDITSDAITSYYVTNGVDTMFFSGLSKGVFSYCDRVNDPLINRVLSAVFTPDGFRLHRSDTLRANKFHEFHVAADSTCLLSESDSVKVIACWDNYIVTVRNAVWNFDQEQFTDTQKALFEQIAAEFKKYNKNYTLAEVGLGRSSGSNAVKGLVFTFFTNAAKSKSNTAALALTTILPSFGKMTIQSTTSDNMDKNMSTIAGKSDAEALVRQLAATFNGTYDIIPNSFFHPTGCELQAVGGGTKYILKQQ